MVDVVVGSDSVVVVGGPSGSPTVALDVGPAGQRGSQIYTDLGKPTDPAVNIPDAQINDLYINLRQSDSEYLYLYKYASFNGVASWIRVLRLVPNTVLNNPIVKFINGEAHTQFIVNNNLVIAKGLYFPLSGLLPDGVLSIPINEINVQYNVLSNDDVSSGLSLDNISSIFSIDVFTDQGYVSQVVPLGSTFIRAFLKVKENDTLINGYRTVHFLVTVGGKDINAKYFDSATITENKINIPAHGTPDGAYVRYLNNGNQSISGLADDGVYIIKFIDSNTVSLISPINPLEIVDIADSANAETHILLRIPEVTI